MQLIQSVQYLIVLNITMVGRCFVRRFVPQKVLLFVGQLLKLLVIFIEWSFPLLMNDGGAINARSSSYGVID